LITADYLNHIRIVDNVFKTLRNMFHGDVNRMIDLEEMQKAVKSLDNFKNRSTQLTEIILHSLVEYPLKIFSPFKQLVNIDKMNLEK
jgi:phosphopantothenate synthetase